jgi:hypothetical protein
MKPPILIKIAGTAVLLLLLSVPLFAQTKSNTWIRGTWEGTGYQTDDQSTWTMLFTARGRKFSIDYPSLNCGGRWQLISIDAYRARFKEKLDHGQDKCTDNGNVVIQRLSKRQVVFFYLNRGTREVTASAVLNRRPSDIGSRILWNYPLRRINNLQSRFPHKVKKNSRIG